MVFLSAANIMADYFDHIWLIDFGESKRLDGDTLQTTKLEGTECYMAPEVASKYRHDIRPTSVCFLILFALGIINWENGGYKTLDAIVKDQFSH